MDNNNSLSVTNSANRQTALYLGLQYIRLIYDIVVIDKKLSENEPLDYQGENILQKAKTNLFNKHRNSNTSNLSKERRAAQMNLREFTDKHPAFSYDESKEGFDHCFKAIQDNVKNVFLDDTYGLEKLALAIPVVLDSEYAYIYPKEGLSQASICLYGESTRLASIHKNLESTYKFLAKQPLSSAQKGTLVGLGVISAALCVAAPIVAVGGITASAATTTGALAAIGFGDMQLGVGILAAIGILAGGLSCGAVYMIENEHNKQRVVSDFRKMSFDQAVLMLSFRCLMEQQAFKKGMPKAQMKERLNDLFTMVADLRADTDYVYFVERQNTEENQKKQELFHRFNIKMREVLEI